MLAISKHEGDTFSHKGRREELHRCRKLTNADDLAPTLTSPSPRLRGEGKGEGPMASADLNFCTWTDFSHLS